jgi:hypothetical protein
MTLILSTNPAQPANQHDAPPGTIAAAALSRGIFRVAAGGASVPARTAVVIISGKRSS